MRIALRFSRRKIPTISGCALPTIQPKGRLARTLSRDILAWMDEFFYGLTAHEILRAVEQIGLEPSGHCLQLNSFENRVFDVRLENGEHVIAKFYRPLRWNRNQIQEEHDFLFDLRADEVPVCAPLEQNGQSIFEESGILFALWPRTGGRAPDEFQAESLQALGRFLGRLHNCGAGRRFAHRPEFSAKSHIYGPLATLDAFLPERYRSAYERTARNIASIYQERSAGVPVLRIHGDCHPGNLLHSGQGWFFLDFDDTLSGPAIQDLWMLLPRSIDPDFSPAGDALLSGYREFRDFKPGWMRLLEVLRALRFVYYAAWIARRWEDPAFPQAFPHFGTDAYWEKETRDLEEQLRLIEKEPMLGQTVSFPEAPATETLSNKDYFYDFEET